jgi:hypothetical protein
MIALPRERRVRAAISITGELRKFKLRRSPLVLLNVAIAYCL